MDAFKCAETVEWFHSWEIAPGQITPGTHPIDPKKRLDGMGLPAELSGKRTLDVGCWDGPIAHELALRGADSVALDLHDPCRTGFRHAGWALHSNAHYIQGSVYDLNPLLHGSFDYVFFLAVWHHLRNPLLALGRIFSVLVLGGELHFEGLVNPREGEDKAKFCRNGHGGYRGTWWIPSVSCVKSWMATSGFSVLEAKVEKDRLRGVAVPMAGFNKQEFPEARI